MPRYFFNVSGAHQITDTEGKELPDDNAAWVEAKVIACGFLDDIDGKFRLGQEWSLEVAGAERKPVFVIRLSSFRAQ